MTTIPLTQGYVALVDDCDAEVVSQFKWYASVERRKDGSIRNVYAGRRRPAVLMHRLIAGVGDAKVHVDHRNHDGLDNQRSNLRICTVSQNIANSHLHSNNTSGVKGVIWHKRSGKWMARIGVNNRKRYLGIFPTKEEAARAYDDAAMQHFGDFALTNENKGHVD